LPGRSRFPRLAELSGDDGVEVMIERTRAARASGSARL